MTSNFPSEKKIYKRVMKDMTKNRKIDDTKPFVHGQEGTHFACQEMVEKYGGKTQCCGCTGHKCTPTTPENRKIECSHVTCAVQGVPDRYLHGKTPTTPEPSDWEREFDREFTSENKNMSRKETMLFEPTTSKIKSFISTLLARKEKALIEKISSESMKDLDELKENIDVLFSSTRMMIINKTFEKESTLNEEMGRGKEVKNDTKKD